ncbi:MAG: hypothetical protein [Caudoviricetes sp.]|nr:MAG: hypothetical protein [Caudoviricetes sp.]
MRSQLKNSDIFPLSYFVSDTVDDDYVDDNSDPLRRVYSQYRNKQKLTQWIQICTVLGSQIYRTSEYLRKSYNIDTVSDELLNIIGRVVVLPRGFITPITLNPPMVAKSVDTPWEVGDDSQQLSGLSTDSDVNMSNEIYRLGIRAKIIKNNTSSTLEDVLQGASFLLPDANVVRVVDNEDMSFSIEYTGVITSLEAYALSNSSMVPKPQGVSFKGFVKVDE